jgi:hypothetical protein
LKIILTIDIAHPPLSGEAADAMLDEALRSVHSSPTLRVINIIHGFGSKGIGGTLKTHVKNWAYTNRQRIHATIDGEQFSPFHSSSQSLVSACGISFNDLSSSNQGTTILWVK